MGSFTFFRLGLFLAVPLTALIFFDITLRYSDNVGTKCMPQIDIQPVEPVVETPKSQVKFDVFNFTKGPPTASLFDNLRDDTKYMITWSNSGWSNDVMAYLNLIYMAKVAGRVAVIPPFIPSPYLPEGTVKMPASEVFDFPRLNREIGHPVVEWSDLKSRYDHLDFLGCWSVWMSASVEQEPRGTYMYELLGTDIAWTSVPTYTNFDLRPFSKLWPLARLGFPEDRKKALNENPRTRKSQKREEYTAPNDHLLCYDFLYFVGVDEHWEWEQDYAPVWRLVGKHLRFTQEVMDLAERHLRFIFGLEEDESIPPFIAIHSRRGDFVRNLCDGRTKDECVRPLPAWRKDVERVRQTVFDEKGLDISRVIMTSDETDPGFWDDVHSYGWSRIGYKPLADTDKPPAWYTLLIDVCIQSMATGFVGTKGSTVSMLAHNRVRDWNNGVAIYVPWKTFE